MAAHLAVAPLRIPSAQQRWSTILVLISASPAAWPVRGGAIAAESATGDEDNALSVLGHDAFQYWAETRAHEEARDPRDRAAQRPVVAISCSG